MYSPKVDPALIPQLHRFAKALGIPMIRLVNQLITKGLDRRWERGHVLPEDSARAADCRKRSRWLRALSIAKVLFEDEGYHTTYLGEIETYIRPETSGQDFLQVARGKTRSREHSDARPA